jgi:hypothetical protein
MSAWSAGFRAGCSSVARCAGDLAMGGRQVGSWTMKISCDDMYFRTVAYAAPYADATLLITAMKHRTTFTYRDQVPALGCAHVRHISWVFSHRHMRR